jgi:hypothetical protein
VSGDGAPESELDGEDEVSEDEVSEDEAAEEAAEIAVRRAELDAELQREAEEFGLTTDDPRVTYGPNGHHVLALLGALPTIHSGMAIAIANAYHSIPEPDYLAACASVDRLRRGRWAGPLWFAEHDVSDWLAELHLRGDLLDLYTSVADAAKNAADAVILKAVITDDDFKALYWPWSVVMGWGPPASPGPATPTGRHLRPRRRLRPRQRPAPDSPTQDPE